MAQPQPRETPGRQAVRDATEQELSAVLGRFRAWNAESSDAPDRSSGLQLAPDAYAEADLQEISYEEALGARRRIGQPGSPAAPKSAGGLSTAEVPAPAPAQAGATKGKRAAVPAVPQKMMPAAKGRAGMKAVGRPVGRKEPERIPAESQAGLSERALVRNRATQQSPPRSRPAGSRSSDLRAADLRPADLPPADLRPADLRPAGRGRSSFQEVMQESLSINMSKGQAPVPASRALVKSLPESGRAGNGRAGSGRAGSSRVGGGRVGITQEERSFAMKLRASDREYAMIQAGASEAGVTIADYMRQCTLDVQVLRALLNQTIADRNLASIAPAGQHRLGAGEETDYPLPTRELSAGGPLPVEDTFTEDTLMTRLKALFFGARRG